MRFYAHSKEGSPESEWQTLEEHSEAVARLSQHCASKFGTPNWGYTVGRLHDIGKYKAQFQARLRGSRNHVDHATAGAVWAAEHISPPAFAKILSYCIVGHHTGIPDGSSGTDDGCLDRRLAKAIVPEALPDLATPALEVPPFVRDAMAKDQQHPSGFAAAFFTRMLFSCLKDADCLDTEAFVEPEQAARRGNYPNLASLKSSYDAYINRRFSSCEPTPLNVLRNRIKSQCIEKSRERPGLFSLTVPTGGGKTLSSMAFALEHAVRHDFERIIYVIPYTSIIEQTAIEFERIFGKANVVQHHSTYAPPGEMDGRDNEVEARRLLATENWDAPIIVTTNVQFFESLFHNKTSKLRKLHNIVRSVVVLDEAQMLPVPLLRPTIEAIRELSEHYHVSLVLCTATQPALNDGELERGLPDVREIARNPHMLEQSFERVRPSYRNTMTDQEIVQDLRSFDQVLCIVNKRDDARRLYNLLDDGEGNFHLSALMCPEHRSRTLETIKARLAHGTTCRVVSTQLVEAGVDVDFPVVYRAIAGLDSIVQAAGRCNRENRIEEGGSLVIFLPESGIPGGTLRQPAEITRALLEKHDEGILSIAVVREYFRELYWVKELGKSLDAKGILEDCEVGEQRLDFPFKSIASKYRLIDDTMESIIVPYDETAREAIDSVRSDGVRRDLLRALQRYSVGIYPLQFVYLKNEGFIETIDENVNVLSEVRFNDAYSNGFGLNPDCEEFCDPGYLCV